MTNIQHWHIIYPCSCLDCDKLIQTPVANIARVNSCSFVMQNQFSWMILKVGTEFGWLVFQVVGAYWIRWIFPTGDMATTNVNCIWQLQLQTQSGRIEYFYIVWALIFGSHPLDPYTWFIYSHLSVIAEPFYSSFNDVNILVKPNPFLGHQFPVCTKLL